MKGNKYLIDQSDCDKYIEWKNKQIKILVGFEIVCALVIILLALIFILK